jgi:hypothetical protein
MPETWDPTIYRERAAAWRDKASSLPEDSRERGHCVAIAENYEKLAKLIEERKGSPRSMRQPGT